MKLLFLTVLLALSACSEALGREPVQCLYTDKTVESQVKQGGQISQYKSDRLAAKQGDERILREHLTLDNGDEVTIEYRYCYMLNYTLTYRLSGEKAPISLVKILPTLNDLILKSKVGRYLTQPFSEIVLESLSMPQKMLKEPFSLGLPSRFTSSEENVEYSFGYKDVEGGGKFSAEFEVYIGVGGL